ncbi:hypothetical protein SCOR_03400 [Sulfidibacter corallicola]|uniref:asparagine synthase (glutamine-hydrolyzing) n=1 Tax=Sulfidibacter corallicola TaxID=2818388 RepID=A0A8A4TGT7_SULCO|nr:asparagine synthase-related protein [Sulfidibacter corallicola]QTD48424.1 hypothetical protein J3U87_22825 [Sulfidibacter corallicola]
MDAFAGFFHFDNRPASADHLRAMVDASPAHQHPWTWTRDSLALGGGFWTARKRSETGHVVEDRRSGAILIATARLHNRTQLGAKLGLAAAELELHDDPALIAKAYLEWGQGCPEHLLGRFALVVFDPHTRSLFCARDHTGIATFYYHVDATRFAFASSPMALLALPGIRARLDETSMADIAVLMPPAPQASMFRDIARLPPGHLMHVADRRVHTAAYWQLNPQPRLELASDEAYGEAFREIFAEAVNCRIRGRRPGILLSGGLDSSAIAAVAAHRCQSRGEALHSYCAVPRAGFPQRCGDGRDADERRYVEALAARWPNLRTHFASSEAVVPFDRPESRFATRGWPAISPHNEWWIDTLLDACRRDGCDTVLVGQLGNGSLSLEVFGFHGHLAITGRWITLAREFRGRARFTGSSHLQLVKGLVRSLLQLRAAHALRAWLPGSRPPFGTDFSFINPTYAATMGLADRFLQKYGVPGHASPPFSYDHHCRGLRWYLSLLGDYWTPLAGSHGLEFADPSADVRLLEFGMSLPLDQHVRAGRDRRLVRDHLGDYLPPAITERTTRGHQAADCGEHMLAWRDRLRNLHDRLTRDPEICRRFDMARLGEALAQLAHTPTVRTQVAMLRSLEAAAFCDWVTRLDRA